MSFTNAKFLLIVLLLSLIHATFAKKALLRKSLAATSGPINDFSAFWDLTKQWSAIFSASKSLAGQIRSDLAVNGTTPVESWDKEMTTLFKQNLVSSDASWTNYWIVKIGGEEGEGVSQRKAEIDVQNGIIELDYYHMTYEQYFVGPSAYADKVRELVNKLTESDHTLIKISKEYFALADTDNLGELSPAEFTAAFSSIIPSGVDIEKFFIDYDNNLNETLSLEEFENAMGKILSLNVPEFYRS